MDNNNNIKRLVLCAMFVALISLSTAYLFHIPIGVNGGYIHLGDAFIYLAACFFPAPYSLIVAAVGAGLGDLLSGAVLWILPTVIIKPASILFFSREAKALSKRNIAAMLFAGFVSVTGYYIAESILFGNWVTPLVSIGANVIQFLGSAVIFIVSRAIMDRAKLL